MKESCIDPTAIQEGDLLAYVEDTADDTVTQHIQQCPACAHEANQIARLQAALKAELYRLTCPRPERLIAYREGTLEGNEKLAVVQHLRQCPHCAQEMASLTRSKVRGPRLGALLQDTFKSIEAVLISPSVQVVGVRSHQEAPRVPKVYKADEIRVIIKVQPSQLQPEMWQLSGVVSGMDTSERVTAELYRGEGLIVLEQVSSRGQFSFAGLDSAQYDLALVWPGQEIWIKGVDVR